MLLLLIRTGQDYYSLNEQRKTHYGIKYMCLITLVFPDNYNYDYNNYV